MCHSYDPALRSTCGTTNGGISFKSGSSIADTYLLALLALQSGAASHVIAVRQQSIAIGAMLGWRWLGEGMTAARAAGVILIVCGCVLMGFTK